MFKKILIPLDRSSLAEQAISQAMIIARGSSAQVDLVLAHQGVAFDDSTGVPSTTTAWEEERAYLASVAHELCIGGEVLVSQDVVAGSAAEAIVRCANEKSADLIVMTSHGRTGLSRLWLGSVTDTVIRHAHVPVLVMRPTRVPGPRGGVGRKFDHVLVPMDDMPAGRAVHAGVDLAVATGASLTLLHVVHPVSRRTPVEPFAPEAYALSAYDEDATNSLVAACSSSLNEIACHLRETKGLRVNSIVLVGNRVAKTIVEFAATSDVDVIAMSTHGRGASRYLLGSVADKVLRATDIPVLVHRPRAVAEDEALLCDGDIAEQLPALSGRSSLG